MNTAFIIGTGRCGTSWLGQMLNCHAEICVPPEIQLLFEYSGNGNRLYEAFSQAGSSGLDSETLISLIERGCPHKLEMFFDYPEFCRRESTPKSSAIDFVEAFYAAIAAAHEKSWLIEQTPWYGQRIDLVSRFFPKAKFIHMVRDGRDVALSFARTPWWHLSPRLNLTRWQTEIKKIALDAAFFLDPDSYLEVKYENLVANTEFEMRRICAFLNMDFDAAMLNPQKLIDYDQFCKFDMKQASSQGYSDWRERKDSASFSENIGAWRKADDEFDAPLPAEIVHWLTHYEYEVEQESLTGVSALQYQRAYSFGALEKDFSCHEETNARLARDIALQIQHNSALEEELANQLAHTRLVEQEWAARGVLIEQHAKSLETQIDHTLQLQDELARQIQCNQLLEQDWVARGALIEQHGHTLEVQTGHTLRLQNELASQVERNQLLEQDWAARGALINEHAGKLDEQINHTLQLQDELSTQLQRNQLLEQDWSARGKLIEQSASSIAAHVESISTLEKDLVKQAEYTQKIVDDWTARGDLINQLSETLQKQELQRSLLEQELARQTEQLQLVIQDRQALRDVNARLATDLDVQIGQGGLLEQRIADQNQNLYLLEQELLARTDLVNQLSNTIQAQANDNSVLAEDISNLRNEIGKLEVELDRLRNSWCGKLKNLLNK